MKGQRPLIFMQENIATTLTDFQLSVVIFLAIAVFKWLLCLYQPKEPLTFFRFYCLQLAAKVNNPQNSHGQQVVAGGIAMLITLVPLLVILWLFHAFVDVLWLWQAMLLYFALGASALGSQCKKIAIDIIANNKEPAKSKLAPLVLRDTKTLSELGLAKSCIELQLLKKFQLIICIGVIFFVFGALAALTFRLLLEMHYCWNPKLTRFKFFGRWINVIVNLVQWLPARLVALIFLLFSLGKKQQPISLLLKYFNQLNNQVLLLSFATLLECRVGGVVMYQGEKLRRDEFNSQAKQPAVNDILRARYWLNCTIAFITAPLFLAAIMPFFLKLL